jgi:hypothetical protein
MGIGKKELDGLETVRGRGRETVEEADLLVHHRQVRGETGHAYLLRGSEAGA